MVPALPPPHPAAPSATSTSAPTQGRRRRSLVMRTSSADAVVGWGRGAAPRSVIRRADDFALVPRAEEVIGLVVDRLLQEVDRAVDEEEIGPAGVLAAEGPRHPAAARNAPAG